MRGWVERLSKKERKGNHRHGQQYGVIWGVGGGGRRYWGINGDGTIYKNNKIKYNS